MFKNFSRAGYVGAALTAAFMAMQKTPPLQAQERQTSREQGVHSPFGYYIPEPNEMTTIIPLVSFLYQHRDGISRQNKDGLKKVKPTTAFCRVSKSGTTIHAAETGDLLFYRPRRSWGDYQPYRQISKAVSVTNDHTQERCIVDMGVDGRKYSFKINNLPLSALAP